MVALPKTISYLPFPLTNIFPGTTVTQYGPYSTYWAGNRETFNVLVRRTAFSSGATAMTGYYGVQPRGPVTPGSPEDLNLIDELTTWIMTHMV